MVSSQEYVRLPTVRHIDSFDLSPTMHWKSKFHTCTLSLHNGNLLQVLGLAQFKLNS